MHEPTSYKIAAKSLEWQKAMIDEFMALIHNQTSSLVPKSPNLHVIGCKWVYKIKLQPNGTIDRYKARLVPKDTISKKALITTKPLARL